MITTLEKTTKRFSYGLDELAEMTGLSVAFLRKLARAGTLKTKKFGARRMVLDADLQEFLKGENQDEK
jgi:excisionase family DNA binding protein